MTIKIKGIKFKQIHDTKNMKNDIIIALLFLIIFLISSTFESSLFLPGISVGLLEHYNIWIFLSINIFIPIILHHLLVNLDKNYEVRKISIKFDEYSDKNAFKVCSIMLFSFGFCFFVGNSLQNAKIINNLEFDYWDSINYKCGYILTRLYKFYLFSYFLPKIILYVLLLIKTVSKLITIDPNIINAYPLTNYLQLNALCNFILNVLFVIIFPIILLSSGVYILHNRWDITTISTAIFTVLSTLTLLIMYLFLINEYRKDILKYKKIHLDKINSKLLEIHEYIINYDIKNKDAKDAIDLEPCLKKESYLRDCKKQIEQINNFPLIIKVILTCVSPVIPTLIKFVISTLKNLL